MKRTILPALLLSGLCCTSTVLADTKADASAIPPGGLRVTSRFTPNSVVAGQSVTYSYGASSGAYCEVTGVPGYEGGGRTGSFTFVASQNLNATVFCEGVDNFASSRAALTVIGNQPPVLSAAYTPNSIFQGQSSTFSWNAQYATSCSSTGLNSVNGTSGSQSVAPVQGSYSTTVTCVNGAGSTTLTTGLNVGPVQLTPTVTINASPDYLWSAGYTTLTWSSTNATSCSSPYTATSGSRSQFVRYSRDFFISCTGPGGTANASTYVAVEGGIEPRPAAKDKLDSAALSGLGIDLNKAGMQWNATDLNADGVKDLIVVDTLAREAHVLLAKNGKFTQIDRSLPGVAQLRDIKSIFVPASAKAAIKVGVEK